MVFVANEIEIYIDESGDLGFGSKSSDYFIIAAIVARDTLPIRRCIKNIRLTKLSKKYKKTSELKFHNSDAVIRNRVLNCLSKSDNDIAYAVLRKNQVYDKLKDNSQGVYNYICGMLVSKIVVEYNFKDGIKLIVDKSLYGVQRDFFNEYLEYKSNLSLDIDHVDSRQYPCVQAVDFVVGAINQKYRDNNDIYYKKLENRVSLALDFFENKNRDYVVNPSLLRPTRQ